MPAQFVVDVRTSHRLSSHHPGQMDGITQALRMGIGSRLGVRVQNVLNFRPKVVQRIIAIHGSVQHGVDLVVGMSTG
jgi:hypothetical protein